MQETRVQTLGQEDPLEQEMATHSSLLAWKIPWTEWPGGLQSMGSQRVKHDWATEHEHACIPHQSGWFWISESGRPENWVWIILLAEWPSVQACPGLRSLLRWGISSVKTVKSRAIWNGLINSTWFSCVLKSENHCSNRGMCTLKLI